MGKNIVKGNFVFDNLFKNAKKFYGYSDKKIQEDLNDNENVKEISVAIVDSELKNDGKNNYLDEEIKENDEKPIGLNKFRDFIKKNKSKEVEDIQIFDNSKTEIRSEKEILNEIVDRESNSDTVKRCRQEDCKNYALSNNLNPQKLTEIINNSIKAAVENLANDVKPPCWKEKNEEESLLDSPCFNETCPQQCNNNDTKNKKDNVKSLTQYSEKALVPSVKEKPLEDTSKIYLKNSNSKRNYNSNEKLSNRKLPTCCSPLSKSVTSSGVCNESVGKCKHRTCLCKKEKRDKSYKPCKVLKTDNRRMTGNVNIYICSEGNDGGNGKKKKSNNNNSESICNSMTVTNSSFDCSSNEVEVCDSQSITSSKTIHNLMTNSKNEKNITDDVTLKCACGKPPLDCKCKSKNSDNEGLCLCDMSSLNPTTSLETCRDSFDYNLNSPKTSDPSPHGDYCVNRIRSRSSSRHDEQCCRRQNNFVGSNLSNCVENGTKFVTIDSGNGDNVKDCSQCDTFSDYSEGKLNCNCEGNLTEKLSSSRNQSERYVIQNIVNCGSRREEKPCNWCKCDNESLYSSEKKSEIDESVCCKNNQRIKTRNKEYCRRFNSPLRNTAYDNDGRQRWRNSDYCILEEENTEECDKSCCKFLKTKQDNLKTESNLQKLSWTPSERDEKIFDKKEQLSNGNYPLSQSVATKMSVAEVVKSFSNVDKSTSSVFFSLNSSTSPKSSPSKVKESKKSSLKWPFSKAKSLIGGKSKTGDIETKSRVIDTSKLEANVSSVEPMKDEKIIDKLTNGKSFLTVPKSTADEKSKSTNREGSLITIKSSNDGETKSKDFLNDKKNTKLSSSKLGSLIADRKNSVQSATNEIENSQEENQSNGTCKCGAVDADMCTCQYPHCKCCNRPKEYCKCDDRKNCKEDDLSCKVCEQSKEFCCCSKNLEEKYLASSESENFLVCTLCCRPEINCCCCNNFFGENQSRRFKTASNFSSKRNKNQDSYESDDRKSQICIYCERPEEKCNCRAPVNKCSFCGMPVDVCNCKDIQGNTCQCKGRLIENFDGGDKNICVTAWKPKRDIRKYFSRNPGERDSPDCSCCETVRPYGSDELPYQRLSVFSDVMTELQQKMNELPSCNRCEKIPCCCYIKEGKSYSSQSNENRMYNSNERRTRSRSPKCRNCVNENPRKCGVKKMSSYQICERCRKTPCRCRKSRIATTNHKKPQAKCYYCKRSPCRCESIKIATPKDCRCSVSPPRSEEQSTFMIRDKIQDRNSQNSYLNKNFHCRCGSQSYGSSLRGQERRCD